MVTLVSKLSKAILSDASGLVDRLFAVHAGSRGFVSHRRHMSKRFFRCNRPGYQYPVCFELENSGIRVAVGDCSATEYRPPYQTGKTVHVHAKTLQTQWGRTHCAGCAWPWFCTAEPLGERRYENWITTTTESMLYSANFSVTLFKEPRQLSRLSAGLLI